MSNIIPINETLENRNLAGGYYPPLQWCVPRISQYRSSKNRSLVGG